MSSFVWILLYGASALLWAFIGYAWSHAKWMQAAVSERNGKPGMLVFGRKIYMISCTSFDEMHATFGVDNAQRDA